MSRLATLIPAFKPQYLPALIHSLRTQSVQPDSIVFSDDSPNGDYSKALRSAQLQPFLQGLRIEVLEGPKKGAYENVKHLLRSWNGSTDYVHILFDDDLLYPDFYRQHLQAHSARVFSCTVSRRWMANQAGAPVYTEPLPASVAGSDIRPCSLDAASICATTVAECRNWLGEFSNALFPRTNVDLLMDHAIGGTSFAGLWDLGAFIAASRRQPLGYISDHLGCFRMSPASNSANLFGSHMKAAHLGFVALAIAGMRESLMSREQGVRCCSGILAAIRGKYLQEAEMQTFDPLVSAIVENQPGAADRFLLAWDVFLRQHGF